MKIIIVGCTHAGTAAAVNLAKEYPNASITVYERNDNISFLSCGIALYVGEVVKDPKGLFYSSPEALANLGITTRMRHDVQEINLENKTVRVCDLHTEEVFIDHFDKIVVTTGSWPIVPKIPGIELSNILLCKNWNHANEIIDSTATAKNVAVIGAGYIGVELAEAFELKGKNVTLVDAENRIMPKYLDKEFTDLAEKEFTDHGIRLALGQKVLRFEGSEDKVDRVVTDKSEITADLVIVCIGFRPNTSLLEGKIDMLPNGAILVDEYMRTSHPDVFAAGDSCAVIYNPTGEHRYIPLATNAIRMGTLVAKNLLGPSIKYLGTQATSGIKIYDYSLAATGLTEESAKDAGKNVTTSTITENYRPEFMPTTEAVTLKIIFEKETHKILGAEFASKHDITQLINTMSVCIQKEMTIEELAFVDFFFQPHFNKPWSILNLVALQALNA